MASCVLRSRTRSRPNHRCSPDRLRQLRFALSKPAFTACGCPQALLLLRFVSIDKRKHK